MKFLFSNASEKIREKLFVKYQSLFGFYYRSVPLGQIKLANNHSWIAYV